MIETTVTYSSLYNVAIITMTPFNHAIIVIVTSFCHVSIITKLHYNHGKIIKSTIHDKIYLKCANIM
jgi:hypothetical protein